MDDDQTPIRPRGPLPPMPPVRHHTLSAWSGRLLKLALILSVITIIGVPIGVVVKILMVRTPALNAADAAGKGHYQEAIALYTEAIAQGDQSWDTFCGRGAAYVALGDRHAARADYHACLQHTRSVARRQQILRTLEDLRE